jgi:hypothetical protein
MRLRLYSGVAFAAAVCSIPVSAQNLLSTSTLAINGYGSWNYGKTNNDNLFLGATPEGSYRSTEFHLNLAATVNDNLRIVTQLGWVDGLNGSETQVDYLFAEWRFSPGLQARIGEVKMPFGIYSEIPNAGTLRPLLLLPQAAYGPIGFLGESYKGVGFSGEVGGKGSKWQLAWDLYGGGTELKEDVVPEEFLLGDSAHDGIETEITRNTLGGRLVLATPWTGLSFGGSALTGSETIAGATRRRDVHGLQAEYTSDRFTVRSEHMHEKVEQDLDTSGSYVEASCSLTPHWQVAAEVGRLRAAFFGVRPVGSAAHLAQNDEVTIGLSYWFDSSFVLKANFLRTNGNLYAHPGAADLPAIVAAGQLKQRTDVLLVGGQFTF